MSIGSSKHDLVSESLIIFWTSSSLTDSKALKAGGTKDRCISRRATSRECIPDFAYFLAEKLSQLLCNAFI